MADPKCETETFDCERKVRGSCFYSIPWKIILGGVLGAIILALMQTLIQTPIACKGAFRFSRAERDRQKVQAFNPSWKLEDEEETEEPIVILISSDGFRWGYQYKVPTPNIDRLRSGGVEAAQGLIPVYPSVTFPNHYSIVTGLYPGSHGIVANAFRDPNNPSRKFTMASKDPDWWLGEPIWETALRQGKRAAAFFWPGSEVKKGLWTCPFEFCKKYNGSVPFEERVDKVLEWVSLPVEERPHIITLYFHEPDHTGHFVGPDAPQIGEAISYIDRMIGRLLDGLESRALLEKVNVLLLGDHGMLSNCNLRQIVMNDFKPWVPDLDQKWFESYFPLMRIVPDSGVNLERLVEALQNATNSGKIRNGEFLNFFLKEKLPKRFNYTGSNRIAPILGVVSEGYSAQFHRSGCFGACFGSHGYDNSLLSMRTIFFAKGPRFPAGKVVDSFRNVEVYALISEILGITPAPHNGTEGFPSSILLPLVDV